MYSIASILRTILQGYLLSSTAEPISDKEQLLSEKPPQFSRNSSEGLLHPFEDLSPAYDSSTWWLDGHFPAHPHLCDDERVRSHIEAIKCALFQYTLEGCKFLVERADNNLLLSSFSNHELLWKAAISVQKYGVIFMAARSECRKKFLPTVQSDLHLFAEIDVFLSDNNNAIRAINYGVHRLVKSSTFTVDYQTRLIPPNAISAIGVSHIAVRAKDFEKESILMLENASPLWDLHDFAHLSAASVAPNLYGSKYFTHLVKLPSKLTALIRSPKMKTADPEPRFSDGVVFSELLTPLFTSEIEAVQRGEKVHTYMSLTNTLAEYIADYLMGRRELQHLTTGKMLGVKHPIRPVELATLVQNKNYELVASEIEQRVFTRGGPAGDAKDDLDKLSAFERIKFIAGCRRWLYFEMRNTIKHRAHKLAYQKVAEHMLASDNEASITTSDSVLLTKTLQNINYRGWENDQVVNLWQIVSDL
jgi:sarcosine oxidase delta subunit